MPRFLSILLCLSLIWDPGIARAVNNRLVSSTREPNVATPQAVYLHQAIIARLTSERLPQNTEPTAQIYRIEANAVREVSGANHLLQCGKTHFRAVLWILIGSLFATTITLRAQGFQAEGGYPLLMIVPLALTLAIDWFAGIRRNRLRNSWDLLLLQVKTLQVDANAEALARVWLDRHFGGASPLDWQLLENISKDYLALPADPAQSLERIAVAWVEQAARNRLVDLAGEKKNYSSGFLFLRDLVEPFVSLVLGLPTRRRKAALSPPQVSLVPLQSNEWYFETLVKEVPPELFTNITDRQVAILKNLEARLMVNGKGWLEGMVWYFESVVPEKNFPLENTELREWIGTALHLLYDETIKPLPDQIFVSAQLRARAPELIRGVAFQKLMIDESTGRMTLPLYYILNLPYGKLLMPPLYSRDGRPWNALEYSQRFGQPPLLVYGLTLTDKVWLRHLGGILKRIFWDPATAFWNFALACILACGLATGLPSLKAQGPASVASGSPSPSKKTAEGAYEELKKRLTLPAGGTYPNDGLGEDALPALLEQLKQLAQAQNGSHLLIQDPRFAPLKAGTVNWRKPSPQRLYGSGSILLGQAARLLEFIRTLMPEEDLEKWSKKAGVNLGMISSELKRLLHEQKKEGQRKRPPKKSAAWGLGLLLGIVAARKAMGLARSIETIATTQGDLNPHDGLKGRETRIVGGQVFGIREAVGSMPSLYLSRPIDLKEEDGPIVFVSLGKGILNLLLAASAKLQWKLLRLNNSSAYWLPGQICRRLAEHAMVASASTVDYQNVGSNFGGDPTTDEARTVTPGVAYFRKRFPKSPIVLLGNSMGALFQLIFLSKGGEADLVIGINPCLRLTRNAARAVKSEYFVRRLTWGVQAERYLSHLDPVRGKAFLDNLFARLRTQFSHRKAPDGILFTTQTAEGLPTDNPWWSSLYGYFRTPGTDGFVDPKAIAELGKIFPTWIHVTGTTTHHAAPSYPSAQSLFAQAIEAKNRGRTLVSLPVIINGKDCGPLGNFTFGKGKALELAPEDVIQLGRPPATNKKQGRGGSLAFWAGILTGAMGLRTPRSKSSAPLRAA